MISNPLEDPFYYLKNFRHVLDWIAARYEDVLTVDEQRFIAGFAQLPGPSQALWVRMIMRKGDHFRAGRLNYPEIGDTALAAPRGVGGQLHGMASGGMMRMRPPELMQRPRAPG